MASIGPRDYIKFEDYLGYEQLINTARECREEIIKIISPVVTRTDQSNSTSYYKLFLTTDPPTGESPNSPCRHLPLAHVTKLGERRAVTEITVRRATAETSRRISQMDNILRPIFRSG
jgi:hypothetical protein